ncbi:MAG: DUF3313 domain-containing protein [Planctomycetota bacterium]
MSRTKHLLLILAVAGCTGGYSGFLDSSIYRQLTPGENPGSKIWLKEGADLRRYSYLMIDPIRCIADKGGTQELTDEQKAKATKAFRDILTEAVDPYYPVVDKAGPNVLRVRIALTELKPSSKDMGVGAAALEVDFRDSNSNEVLCAAVSRIEGSERGKWAKDEWQAVELFRSCW